MAPPNILQRIMNASITYNEDCMAVMSRYPDKWFDLAVVDPPYGIGQPKQSNLKGYNGRPDIHIRIQKNRLNQGSGKLKTRLLNNSNCDWDDKTPDPEYFKELFRVSKNQIIWGGNYFPLQPTRCVIAWDKVQPWENFSQWEMAWTSFDSPAQLYRFDNRTGDKIHPTQKPVALYDWIFKNYAKPTDKILDTHLGSGSSRIAAHRAGLDFTGCEIDKDYFDAQEKRFSNYVSQHRIIFPETVNPKPETQNPKLFTL